MADNLREKIEEEIKKKEENLKEKQKKEEPLEKLEIKKNVFGEVDYGFIKLVDIANFCRELAIMLEVGVPLLKALELITKRTRKVRLKKILEEVVKDVSEGTLLSEACSKHKVFPKIFIDIVKVGESGGILDQSLKRLESIFMKQLSIRNKIKSALAYPTVALLAAIVVITVILIKVVPQFEMLYKMNEVELPKITKFVISTGHFVQIFWWLIFLVVFGIYFGFKFLLRIRVVKIIYDFVRLYLPLINKVYVNIVVAQILRTFETLMKSGIPLLDSIKILRETAPNYFFAKEFDKVAQNVQQGNRMGEVLSKSPIFPPIVVDMLSIGEETGSVETVLEKMADFYEENVDIQLKALSSIIEPLLIIVLGGVVLFIAVAFLYPYFNLVNVIKE